jgi:hypothetical protein
LRLAEEKGPGAGGRVGVSEIACGLSRAAAVVQERCTRGTWQPRPDSCTPLTAGPHGLMATGTAP